MKKPNSPRIKSFGAVGRHGISAFATAALLMAGANNASAHANAIGYTPGANAGEVNLWLGSWHTNGIGDGNDVEGSANLVGTSSGTIGYNTTNPFSYGSGYQAGTAPLPAGLIPGTNLIFAPGEGLWDVYSWEAVTISGLAAGDYQFNYIPIANPTQHWTPAGGLQGITLTLTAGDVGGGGQNAGSVPDGGSTALMLGATLFGFGAIRRKFKRA